MAGLALWFAVIGIVLNSLGVDTFLLKNWGSFTIIVDRIWAVMSNWVLVALPNFVFMGLMLDRSGVAENLMTNFVKVFGRMRGGLAITVVLIGLLLAASTGIVGASVVLLATLAFPIMMERGYSKELASGVVAGAGTLGILIPPSIMLVIMADQLSLSVGDLFMGAVIPGVMMGLMYIVYVIVIAQLKPHMAPAPPKGPPLTARDIASSVLAVVPPAVLILAVLGSIFFGVATPTEASALGALGATILAAVNKRLSWETVRKVSRETMLTTAFIFGLFVGANAFALVLRALGGDEFVSHLLTGLPFGKEGLVLFILFIAFLAGFFLDWLEITLIILPLVAPGREGGRLRPQLVRRAVRGLPADLLPHAAGRFLALLREGRRAAGDHDAAHLSRDHSVRDHSAGRRRADVRVPAARYVAAAGDVRCPALRKVRPRIAEQGAQKPCPPTVTTM